MVRAYLLLLISYQFALPSNGQYDYLTKDCGERGDLTVLALYQNFKRVMRNQ